MLFSTESLLFFVSILQLVIATDPNPCTWSPSQIQPTDIPKTSPYVSSGQTNYYPVGDQKGLILDGKYHAGYVFGPTDYPTSNSYALAVQECSQFCDNFAINGHGACLSFNAFTVVEDDYNNCVPTFECRFSNSTYNPDDYYSENGTPSFVWTTAIPSCPLNVTFSPELWNENGMDIWLASYARNTGLNGQTLFTQKLMNSLGWQNYDCDSPAAAGAAKCVDSINEQVQPCANWINRQLDLYFTYFDQIYNAYNTWQAFMGNQGPAEYVAFWNPNPPSSSSFNEQALAFTTINALLGCIPDIGSAVAGLASIAETIWGGVPDNTQIQGPSQSTTWYTFIKVISQAMEQLADQVYNIGKANGGSDAILQVIKGGSYFLDNADSVYIDPDNLWANYNPWYYTQVALAAMGAQGVFLLRAPISGVGASSCSQSVADQIARYIMPNPNNIGWCDPDGQHVVIPVNGWNMDLYRVLSTATNSPLNMTLPALGESAWQCYSQFSPSNATISPFTPPNLGHYDFITTVPDLTAPCMWAIPVCDYDTWSQAAVNQSESEGKYWYNNNDYQPLKFSDELSDVAEWFSYQLGFRSYINWCAMYHWCDPPYGCEWQRNCDNQKWSKKITVVSSSTVSGTDDLPLAAQSLFQQSNGQEQHRLYDAANEQEVNNLEVGNGEL